MALQEQIQPLYLAEDQTAGQMFYVSGVLDCGYPVDGSMRAYFGAVTDDEYMTLEQTESWVGFYEGSGVVAPLPKEVALGGLWVYTEKLVFHRTHGPLVERGWFNEMITKRRHLTRRSPSDFEIIETDSQAVLIPISDNKTLFYDPGVWEQ